MPCTIDSIRAAIAYRLSNFAGLNEIIPEEEIHHNRVPQGAELPAIALKFARSIDQNLGGAAGWGTATFTVGVLAIDAQDAIDATKQIALALDGFTGDIQGVRIMDGEALNSSLQFIRRGDGSDSGVWLAENQYQATYRVSVPTF